MSSVQDSISALQVHLFYLRKSLETNELIECEKNIDNAYYFFENYIKPRMKN